MAANKYWSNVAVAMAAAAALGAATVIDSITKANPAVVSYTGNDPAGLATGAWVLLEVNGMTQVNNRLFRVANFNATNNTFELEGVDSTAFNNFNAGTFKVISSFGLGFSTLSEPQAAGGDPIFEDTTTIHSPEDTQDIVGSSPQTYGFTSLWDPADAALVECNRAFVTRTARPVLITYSDGSKFAFYGTLVATLAPQASGKKVTTPVSFALKGSGTAYAS